MDPNRLQWYQDLFIAKPLADIYLIAKSLGIKNYSSYSQDELIKTIITSNEEKLLKVLSYPRNWIKYKKILQSKIVAELVVIGKTLNVKDYKKLKKTDLINAILDVSGKYEKKLQDSLGVLTWWGKHNHYFYKILPILSILLAIFLFWKRSELSSEKFETIENKISETSKESSLIQSLKDEPVSTLGIVLRFDSLSSPRPIGFRIMTENLGSLFFYLRGDTLALEDRKGVVINSYASIGTDLSKGYGSYYIDLEQAGLALKEHSISNITLEDLEKASLDFMTQEGEIEKLIIDYSISITAEVSNWMLSCGSFSLEKSYIIEHKIPVLRNYFAIGALSSPFDINLIGNYSFEEQGKDLENQWIRGMWGVIDKFLGSDLPIHLNLHWPEYGESLNTVPMSVGLVFGINPDIIKYDIGKIGDVKPLLYKINEDSSIFVVLINSSQIEQTILSEPKSSKYPPDKLLKFGSYLLSYWKNSDRLSRPVYTEVPLSRMVFVCVLDKGLKIWEVNCKDLHAIWVPEWTILGGNKIETLPIADENLRKSTMRWKLFPYVNVNK